MSKQLKVMDRVIIQLISLVLTTHFIYFIIVQLYDFKFLSIYFVCYGVAYYGGISHFR